MRKLGLKLWSINKNYRDVAVSLFNQGVYDYIELYAIPDSYDDNISLWEGLDIPFIIHAPHFMQGVNFSIAGKYDDNMRISGDSFKFADKLNAEYIIFHPGIGGSYIETGLQMAKIKDSRVLVENKPYNIMRDKVNLTDEVCVGAKFEEVEYILDKANVGFCLDIGHLFSASNALQRDKFEELKKFNTLNPKIYHLSDGNLDGDIDKHLHFGAGGYPLKKIVDNLINDIPLTIETDKASTTHLDDFAKDVNILKQLMQ